MTSRHCIGVDWGSTNFRAWLFADGHVTDTRQVPESGIRTVPPGGFEAKLFDLLNDWLDRADQMVLAGMITSRNVWIETPYLECPASVGDLLSEATEKSVRGVNCIFLPGLCQRSPSADVMRGEELQILGAMTGIGEETIVLPGTHSKWARLHDGVVQGFGTWMTGELFDLLLNQSLAGRLAQDGPRDLAAFSAGLDAAETGRTLMALFAARSRVLLEELPATGVADYLSGLLIGAEVMEARAQSLCDGALTLVGEPALAGRYESALARFGLGGVRLVEGAAERGFAAILARAASCQ